MIDRKFIGHVFPVVTQDVERGRLRFFARSIGQDDPVYTDVGRAQAAGYDDLPAPPTFLFGLHLETGFLFDLATLLGVELGSILHAEQAFIYHRTVCAGDRISFHSAIADIYDKKGGALEFVVQETKAVDAAGCAVADLRGVYAVRHGGAG